MGKITMYECGRCGKTGMLKDYKPYMHTNSDGSQIPLNAFTVGNKDSRYKGYKNFVSGTDLCWDCGKILDDAVFNGVDLDMKEVENPVHVKPRNSGRYPLKDKKTEDLLSDQEKFAAEQGESEDDGK